MINWTSAKLTKALRKKISQKINQNEEVHISYGWIDSHVHLFQDSTYHLSSDLFSDLKGVVAVIEAGSSGTYNFVKNYKENMNHFFKTYYLLNVSSKGLVEYPEINDNSLNLLDLKKFLNKYHEIIGIKFRYSRQAVAAKTDYEKILKTLQNTNIKVMYHIGNEPPAFDKLLQYIKKGDIITHYSHGKNENIINNIGYLKQKDVFLDLGMGHESLSIKMFNKFLQKNIMPDTISTDLHNKTYNNKFARLEKIIEYLLSLNINISCILKMLTIIPYEQYLNKKYNNYLDTKTIFSIEKKENGFFEDSQGYKQKIHYKIRIIGVINEKEEIWY